MKEMDQKLRSNGLELVSYQEEEDPCDEWEKLEDNSEKTTEKDDKRTCT